MADFATDGRADRFPPTYADSHQRAEYSTWPTDVIERRLAEYALFLADPTLWKSDRTRAAVALNVRHFTFELAYRQGAESFQEYLTLQHMEADCEQVDNGADDCSL